MLQPALAVQRFYPRRNARVALLSGLMLAALLICALLALLLSSILWSNYAHNFTPYLKWQDALVALLWFIAFIALGGSIFVVRFLCALHSGAREGMLLLEKGASLIVRDLAAENLASIFWMMTSAFGCFAAVLAGLMPAVLLGWTLHLSPFILAVLATGIVGVISLGGVVVSIVTSVFIVLSCVGVVSFCRRLGGAHVYPLTSRLELRIDNCVLTITYPTMPECMVDLKLLAEDAACQFLFLLHESWLEAEHPWNPLLDKEIEDALDELRHRAIYAGSGLAAIKTPVVAK